MISNSLSGRSKIECIRPFNLVTNEKYAHMTEVTLVLACQRNEHGAIEHLLKRQERTITNILYRLAPDCADTSDIRQEVSIKIWRSILRLKNAAQFKSWLKKIVANSFYDELRKRPHPFRLISMDEPFRSEEAFEHCTRDIKDCSLQPDEIALKEELSRELTAALSTIPEQFKTAIILRDVDGLSYEEIAVATHAELGTVKSRIARARQKVQQQLVPYLQSSA